MLASALDLDATQKRLAATTLKAARRARFGTLDRLAAIVAAGQVLSAQEAAAAVPLMLAEQGIDDAADAVPVPSALAATASDGRSLGGLMDYTRSEGVTGAQFDMIVLTTLADTARSASLVGSLVRPKVTGYVRMLEVPSCSRCAVLAGKFYRHNTGFQRHPHCDCRHIPSTEDTATDLRTDPKAYFDSLSESEQDRIFTKAGAKVIREGGADIGQVVNARAGMSTAQPPLRGNRDRWTARGRLARVDVFGRPLYTTTEGMTKRGLAYKARGKQYVRLMPESIVELAAGDRAELLRLLKVHGYVK
jgi:hypothetical protein